MAEILEFLRQSAHVTKAKQASKQLTRPCDDRYEFKNESFRLPLGKIKSEGGEML